MLFMRDDMANLIRNAPTACSEPGDQSCDWPRKRWNEDCRVADFSQAVGRFFLSQHLPL